MAEPELIEAYLISMRVRRDAQKVTVSDQVGGHTQSIISAPGCGWRRPARALVTLGGVVMVDDPASDLE